jgi:MFS family permease
VESDSNRSINKDPYISLRYSEFRAYLCVRFFLTFAYQIQAVVIGWHIYNLTKDPLSLGMIGLAEAIPSIGIALYGGYVADKSEKRNMLKWILFGIFSSSLVLYLTALPSVASGIPSGQVVWIMYAMIFVIGITRGFMGPTFFSIMASIVPREHYPNSSTWNSTFWQIATIAGPAAGGLMYGSVGVSTTFLVILIMLSISFACIFFLKKHPPQYIPKENIYDSLSRGIKFVFNSKMMLGAMSLDLFSVFFGGAVALIPVLAKEVLHLGAEEFGLMRAAPALGAVLTMLMMTKYPPMNRPWRNLLIAVTGFGVSIIGYGLSRNFYLTLVFLFAEGAFDSVSVIIRSTIMQLLTPDEMRGRVSAVNSMFIGSSNELGAFESGVAARLLGTVQAIVFGGGVTLAVVTATYFKTKKLIPLGVKEIHGS